MVSKYTIDEILYLFTSGAVYLELSFWRMSYESKGVYSRGEHDEVNQRYNAAF